MSTIYDRILHDFKTTSDPDGLRFVLSESLNSSIVSNLVNLLKVSCGIDLSGEPESFIHPRTSSDEFSDPEISYKFAYGKAVLSLDTTKNALNVSFSFSDKSPVTLCKDIVGYVYLDHDMIFQKIAFKRIFEYAKPITTGVYGLHVWAALIVYTELDKNLFKTHHINYQNNVMYEAHEDHLTDLFDEGLNLEFLSPSDDFDNLLFQFLQLTEENTASFYSVFPEQVSHLDIMSGEQHMINSLNILHAQYVDNKDLLKSNLSLVDMALI